MRTRSLLPTAILTLLAASRAPLALAQAPAEPAAPPVSQTPPAVTTVTVEPAPSVASKSKDSSGRDTLSVDFPDEDIRNILRNVADLFELNLVMPDTLQGKSSIKLRDVTWRQIFQNVLAPVNYTYIEDGNIIKIVSNESLTQEPVSTEVFLINYARAADILPTITTLVDAAAGGRIVVDVRSNSLVITERPSRMNRIRPIIETLDRATDQVMIETKFVEVTGSDVKNIGVNWASLANYQISARGLGGDFTRGREQIASNGFESNNGTINNSVRGTTGVNSIANIAGQTSGSNTAGSVTSTNGTPTSTSTTGTTGSITNSTTSTNTNGTDNAVTNTVNNVFNSLNSLVNNDGTARSLNAVFSASDFSLVLSALQTLQDTKIVSNPTIVTLNNSQATINVGQERPIPSYTYNSERGTYEVSGFTYKPIGIILRVTPQVNSRGFIKLTVEPEVSQSNRDAVFNGASIPIVETRKASTTVSLKDGFTMGIGGLLQTSGNKSQNKVPVLGSIPGLGRLFRSDNHNVESTNLIIFITAKTISAEGAPLEQVFESERVRGLKMRQEDLPGYRDGSSPFVVEPTSVPSTKKKSSSRSAANGAVQ